MSRGTIALAAAGWLAVGLHGQTVDINPEFRRVDPFGAVAEADRGLDLPPVDAGADFPALQVVREYVADTPLRSGPQPLTVRGIIRRNAIQDMALATSIEAPVAGPEAIERQVLDLLSMNVRLAPRVFGAEWYLRLRDYLYTQASSAR